ncbi:S41 family peptidase [Algoriphagus sediminis]|uniref:S41 family peptidase n=1 Tax=Algoriphagus sediminis TaxID=3057113 RepID=A0ABT7YH03_9BACT|nr:S41 family peptidase [Algoriphagus sediminis]MDN3205768.1 S41 family peptidase [Algoriphagus sediminis]
MRIKRIFSLFLLIISFGFFISCDSDNDNPPQVDPESNDAVNRWTSDIMNQVYFWLAEIGTPIDESSDPEDYFESLLNRPTDRFSEIFPDYDELIGGLTGVTLEAGYEFNLFRAAPGSNDVFAEITYVKKNSPASEAGLIRGDRITAINGTSMTVDNFQDLLGQIDDPHTINYFGFEEDPGEYVDRGQIDLTPIRLTENPNFLDSIYTINDQKIGYVIYHFFSPGPDVNSNFYDEEMDQIFARFRAEGINHLIIDLRYNGGGFVGSAVNLASLIAPNVTDQDVFSKTKYNSFLEQFEDFQNVQTEFRTKEENLGSILTGNRVYVLTSARTASASELLINGLRPYMDVKIIGDLTVGKNVGSIPFQDEQNSSNKYGLLPIVTQSSNSLDQSDYGTGFVPDIQALERTERLLPLGDINELLLRTAIEDITGMPSSGRFEKLNREDVGSTLERKLRFGRLIEDPIKTSYFK